MSNNDDSIFFLFTCVRNGRKYIKRLFDSLLIQTKINFVHYIYEDGSSDSLNEIVEDYKNAASKRGIKVYYEKNDVNIGLNLSTLHCIKQCNKKFFIWIDCDNWIDSHFFEELEKTYKFNKNAVVIRSQRFLVNNNGDVFNKNDMQLYRYSIKARNKYDQYLIFNKYYFSFFAVEKSFFEEVNPDYFIVDNKSFFNDQQILFICSKHNKRFIISKKSIGYCLIRNDSKA